MIAANGLKLPSAYVRIEVMYAISDAIFTPNKPSLEQTLTNLSGGRLSLASLSLIRITPYTINNITLNEMAQKGAPRRSGDGGCVGS